MENCIQQGKTGIVTSEGRSMQVKKTSMIPFVMNYEKQNDPTVTEARVVGTCVWTGRGRKGTT